MTQNNKIKNTLVHGAHVLVCTVSGLIFYQKMYLPAVANVIARSLLDV